MKKNISSCPVCGGDLYISELKCCDCGLELRKNFEISIFDKLTGDQLEFLIEFLKHQGNLKSLQNTLGISYPSARKKLNELLYSLNLCESGNSNESTVNASEWNVNFESTKPSDIIKAMLIKNNGLVTVRTYKRNEYKLKAISNSKFYCDEISEYDYRVFDIIVDLIKSQGGRAKKGYGRRRLGEVGCEETTIAGAIMKNYFGKCEGDSCFDPTFALIAVLEWAGIVTNGWGWVELTDQYKKQLNGGVL